MAAVPDSGVGVLPAFSDEGEGPAVLCIHGWGASRKFWVGLAASLPGRRVVRCDLPGFADAPKSRAPFTMTWYVGVLVHLLDHLGLERVAVVGHSMGGMIAALLAILHPDRVERLVLVNAPIRGRTSLFWKSQFFLLPLVRFLVFVFTRVRWVRRLFAADFTYEQPLEPELIDDVAKGSYAAMVRSLGSMVRTDLSGRLGEVRSPTLVVGSDRDRIVRAEQFRLAAEGIPGAERFDLAETGHCPMAERPELFQERVGRFLGCDGQEAR